MYSTNIPFVQKKRASFRGKARSFQEEGEVLVVLSIKLLFSVRRWNRR